MDFDPLSGSLRPQSVMLGPVRAVTLVVRDPHAVAAAYASVLEYRLVARGTVSAPLAAAWAAPAAAGRDCLVLGPRSGEPVWLRLVAAAAHAPSAPALRTHGWNANEILVEDPDAIAARCDGVLFRVIGAPASLTRFPMIRAMQALGPAGECLYFTRVGPGSGLDLASARGFVDRTFIVVVGGADLAALLAFYGSFGNELDPPVRTPVRVISSAHGLPADTLHGHALVKLGAGTFVELDEYPPSARPRAAPEGDLPCGYAIVTFGGRAPAHLPPLGPAAPCALPGAEHQPALTYLGPAGERLELLEAA